ncbi:hypothetical protein MSAN_02133200 [Mycena sanguinolenta]|uniref:Protein kinase domain-containing protein n=1 Tax=Mycena sanguinolenta TaxID=230812 RepID=A0A8H7CK82_9AGAR|nr:hypothetical protein MSAN_02133200 [Mycena sanguinolenta]
MEDHPQAETEFTHSSTCEPESPSHASGMFSHSQQFSVTGGTFTNVTNNNYTTVPSLPSDFRMIPMGDIDLWHQIRVDECTGIAYSQRQRACVRQVHSAKARIDGRTKRVTVALYQGNDAQEEWRKDIDQYMSMRHPNIVQICGAASSNGLHAAIFNDDLIPLRHFLDHYRESHFSTVYIYACCNKDFSEVYNYLSSEFHQGVFSDVCTKWIRRSTGRLCAEFTQHNDVWLSITPGEFPDLSGMHATSALHTDASNFVINSLTLGQYHLMCWNHLAQIRPIAISASTTVDLGAVFRHSGDLLEESIEIAFSPRAEAPPLDDWRTLEGSTGEVMPNGWTRFQSDDVINNILYLSCTILSDRHPWLSQANHIFRRLHIMSNFEDYVPLYAIDFTLRISGPTGDPPVAFLFLSPRVDFQTGPSSFRSPACPAYWSFHPSGADPLSSEHVTQLGFPPFELTASAFGTSWSASVYEGLRQFHQAKGFDPYSQDVARHLGHQLYQLSSQRDAQFAYVDSDDEEFDADIDSDSNSVYAEDYESEYGLTSVCEDSRLDIEAQSSHSERDNHNSFGRSCRSENKATSNSKNHEASESTVEEDMITGETPVPSPTFRIVLHIQLMLILFLAVSGVYDHI